MPIYTRTGDTGTTSLFGGKRLSKSDARVEFYGSLDELNSWLGTFDDKLLFAIQSDLMTMSSVVAGWKEDLSFLESRVLEMERWIDETDKKLPRLTNFVLPKGRMQIARSVCRRVERLAVREKTDPRIIKYLNRLSDLLFTMARVINRKENAKEIVWSGIPRPKIKK